MSVTLGTEWKKVCQASTQITQNITGYVRLYMKYGNRSGLNDTIYWEIRQFAYNQYGTYNAWQWLTPIAYSIKSGNTTKASDTIDQSAWIKSYSSDETSNEVVKASGSYTQAHNSDGSFSATITLSAPIYNTTYTATGDIVLPTIEINPTLTINSAGTMTTSGSSINYTLGSTNGRSTKVQYSTNGSSWTNWPNQTKTVDGTYTATLPSLLSSFPNTYTPTVYFRAITGNYSSGSKSKQITISSNIKPSISAGNITLTAMNDSSYTAISGLFVQGLSWIKVEAQGTAYTNGGASINRYDLTALGGYNSSVTKSNMTITNSKGTYTYTTPFQKSGSITAKVKVYDTRGGTAEATSNSVTVIPYSNPSISSFKVQRCTSNGTLSDTGTYCKITVVYNIAPIDAGTSSNHNYKNTKTLTYSINNTTGSITLSGYSGTATKIVGNGNLATNTSYPASVTLSDISKSVTQSATLPTSFVLVSKKAGGKGITFGAIAEQDGFHNHLDSYFYGNLILDGRTLKPNILTAHLGSNHTLSSTAYEQLTLVESVNIGSDLSINSGGIKCSRTGYVKVSAKMSFNSCSIGLKWFTIYRDNEASFAMPFNAGTDRISLSIPPTVIYVNANQIFYMKVLGASGDVIRNGRAYTEMTIEYI